MTSHVSVDSSEPRSSAMRGIETDRIVMVKPTLNRPSSTVASTTQGYFDER